MTDKDASVSRCCGNGVKWHVRMGILMEVPLFYNLFGSAYKLENSKIAHTDKGENHSDNSSNYDSLTVRAKKPLLGAANLFAGHPFTNFMVQGRVL